MPRISGVQRLKYQRVAYRLVWLSIVHGNRSNGVLHAPAVREASVYRPTAQHTEQQQQQQQKKKKKKL